MHCPGRVTSRNSYLGSGRETPPAGHWSCGNKPRRKSGCLETTQMLSPCSLLSHGSQVVPLGVFLLESPFLIAIHRLQWPLFFLCCYCWPHSKGLLADSFLTRTPRQGPVLGASEASCMCWSLQWPAMGLANRSNPRSLHLLFPGKNFAPIFLSLACSCHPHLFSEVTLSERLFLVTKIKLALASPLPHHPQQQTAS